jgi:sulfur carrier protein ThiS adenylyltransferase
MGDVKLRYKPDADVLVLNGFPADEQQEVKHGDCVALVKRGEIPSSQELESLMTARHTPGVYERLKRAVVGIAGLGGLGSAVAVALARTAVGSLILTDFDVVEPSNLNRQQYFVEHLGQGKTEALTGILSRINPHLSVSAHPVRLVPGNIPEIFRDADVIVECFDKAEDKAMLLETVDEFLPKAYLISASGLAGYGESNRIRTFHLGGERLFLVGDLTSAAEPGRGLMAPRVGIAAHHQANLAVSLLMDPQKAREECEQLPDAALSSSHHGNE